MRLLRSSAAFASLLLAILPGCGESPACTRTSDCEPGAICLNGECVAPIGDAGGGMDAGRADGGALDAGSFDGGPGDDGGASDDAAPGDAGSDAATPDDAAAGFDAGFDASLEMRRDAGFDAGRDSGFAGRDAGFDAGPPCECSGSTLQVRRCGSVCGREGRRCDGCRFGPYGPCLDDDTLCGGDAPHCRNDFCWGWRAVHEVGSGPVLCIDFGTDYTSDPGYGSLDVEVFGRPGATWAKDDAHLSCGEGFAPAQSGVLDAFGRDGYARFVYGGPLMCTEGTIGQYESQVRIIDTVGPAFTLPNTVVTGFFNSTCGADRNTCAAVSGLCL